MSNETPPSDEDRVVAEQLEDARRALIYLVVRESEQYIKIMDVLESSIRELMPIEVGAALRAGGTFLDDRVVEARLDKLHEWGVVTVHTDPSRILRHTDLLARNWRYTATRNGRQVHRFYRKMLAGAPAVREIPLQSLARVVETAESLACTWPPASGAAEQIGQLFVNHDDLDAALVGAEDGLTGLVDRFDLNDASTAELKTLLVGYATRVAWMLDRGSARAHRALFGLRSYFAELATIAVGASDARTLIERGALVASRGGQISDWEGLCEWFDPEHGRASRFAQRLVRALPGMHVNLRRLHSSSGTASSRGRALSLARACRHPVHGTSVLLAALGDHSWRKLYGEADDAERFGAPPWREGPGVEVPELLRATGRAGARGRLPAARDDAAAREAVAQRRAQRRAEHDDAIREVLRVGVAGTLSEGAARIALASLLAAIRSRAEDGVRTASLDGLACTVFRCDADPEWLRAPTWRVQVPGRRIVFHLPNHRPQFKLAEQREHDGTFPHVVSDSG